MNPEGSLNPQQKLEMRVTALLLGELPPDQAETLRAQIATDPELAALHAQLERAIALLREARKIQPGVAEAVPARLSAERRERLLAHFKTTPIAAAPPRRDRSWMVSLAIAATVVVLVGGSLMNTTRFEARWEPPDLAAPPGGLAAEDVSAGEAMTAQKSRAIRVLEDLRLKDAAVDQYAVESNKPASADVAAGQPSAGIAFAPADTPFETTTGFNLMPKAVPGAPKPAATPAPATSAKSIARTDASRIAGFNGGWARGSTSAASSPSPEKQEAAARAATEWAEQSRTMGTAPLTAGNGLSSATIPKQGAGQWNTQGGAGAATSTATRDSLGRTTVDEISKFSDSGGIAGITTFGNTGEIGGIAATPANRPLSDSVEANSVEITQSNLKELNFDWLRSQPNVSGSTSAGVGAVERDFFRQNPQLPAISLGPGVTVGDPVPTSVFADAAPATKNLGRTFSGSGTINGWTDLNEPLRFGAAKDANESDRRPLIRGQAGVEGETPVAAATPPTRMEPAAQSAAPAERGELVDAMKPVAPAPLAELETTAGRRLTKADAVKKEPAYNETRSRSIGKVKNPAEIPVKELATDDDVKRIAAPLLTPQPEIATSENAFSTFSLNVTDVAFKLAAASLEQGRMPEAGSMRSEEFINAFDYRDPEPTAGAPLAFASERARYPFAQNRDLLRLSVKTASAGRAPGRALNIVLLLDNSGSMERADRVRIVQEALRVLAAQLQPADRLSVITFARTPRLWVDGVSGNQAAAAIARVAEMTPEGGTNLEGALDLGYQTAHRYFRPANINRVVLLTDGAANLGDVDPEALKQKVEAERKRGIALDAFGIGWEGLDDTMLETLSRNGDGRYGFINTPTAAATEFAGQLAGALRVAASDVKVQVEFNPRRVTAYRQIGYAKHQLTKEQFRDNTVDAAEIGAAESGNALYAIEVNPRGEGDIATVRVRFKVPGTSDYREHSWSVPFTPNAPALDQAPPSLRLAGTAAAFSEMLAGSQFAAEVTSDALLRLINGVPAAFSPDPRPAQLARMIQQARSLSGR